MLLFFKESEPTEEHNSSDHRSADFEISSSQGTSSLDDDELLREAQALMNSTLTNDSCSTLDYNDQLWERRDYITLVAALICFHNDVIGHFDEFLDYFGKFIDKSSWSIKRVADEISYLQSDKALIDELEDEAYFFLYRKVIEVLYPNAYK
jgi:hypothetical protein